MISAVNNQGLLRFMMYEQNMNARVLLRFLRRLSRPAKVFISIWQGLIHTGTGENLFINDEASLHSSKPEEAKRIDNAEL